MSAQNYYTPLFEAIAEFLATEGFTKKETSDEVVFIKDFEVPGRTMIINGTRMVEQSRTVQFPIHAIGSGCIFTNALEDGAELQGFTIGNSDIWVDSLEDFQFWYLKVFER